MKNSAILLATLVLAFFAYSCTSHISKDENSDKITIEIDTDSDEIKAEIEDGMEDLEEGLEDMATGLAKMVNSLNVDISVDGEQIESADFRDLKKILPERLMRMDRTSFSGERSGIKGLKVSVAEAEYEDDDRRLEIKIVDGAGFASFALAGWSMLDIDKEDRNGYERTTTIDGHKAFEKYNSKWEEGELAILYEDRFIITIEGKGIDKDDLRRALNKLDLDDLDDL